MTAGADQTLDVLYGSAQVRPENCITLTADRLLLMRSNGAPMADIDLETNAALFGGLMGALA